MVDRILADLVPPSASNQPSFEGLVRKWSRVAERTLSTYDMTLDDYLNDVAARDVLEDLISRLPKESGQRLVEALQRTDAQFRSGTVEVTYLSGQHWWGRRLPSSMGDEISEQARELAETVRRREDR